MADGEALSDVCEIFVFVLCKARTGPSRCSGLNPQMRIMSLWLSRVGAKRRLGKKVRPTWLVVRTNNPGQSYGATQVTVCPG